MHRREPGTSTILPPPNVVSKVPLQLDTLSTLPPALNSEHRRCSSTPLPSYKKQKLHYNLVGALSFLLPTDLADICATDIEERTHGATEPEATLAIKHVLMKCIEEFQLSVLDKTYSIAVDSCAAVVMSRV